MSVSVAAITAAALLVASPSVSDADRIAANGGFLLGNAQRCGIEEERLVRTGHLIRRLIAATAADESAKDDATARFSAFFLVSAVTDPKEEKLVASCRKVTAEFRRLENHQVPVGDSLVGSEIGPRGKRPIAPGAGE